jgi:two-component system, sensor histidine kinase
MQEDDSIPVEVREVDTSPLVSGRQILVVDDTPANLIAVEAALAPLQRRIVMCASAEEALARLLDEDFALILLDVQMPGIDGYETARLIRGRERTEHIPIIFMTAHDHNESAILRAYSLGAVDFLFKPVHPDVLRAKASVFVTLQERTEQLAGEQMERDFENRRRDYETAALRRERDREAAANQELARLNEALAASDRRKDTFIAILAHELRNPLAPVRTCIDLVRADPERRVTPKMLDILDRQTSALSRLVDDLLDLSRIKADKLELRPELVDLVEVVESALTVSRPHIDERGHALIFEAPCSRIDVVADTVRLAQVISNLLNNAARYTRRGGRIELRCGIAGENAFVRIVDNGVGIPPELQASIFSMFVQERVSSDGSGGLGLGLALSRRLVDLHSGTISAHSLGRDQGSTFEVQLPLASSNLAITPRKRTRDMEPLQKPVESPAIRTVVIDDNEDARELLSDLLRSKGYEVMTAGDGPSGVDLIQHHRPHVALIDLGLPGMDGIGVIEVLKATHPELQTRLVALTGYGETSDRERTQRAGFHAHLVKPASASEIFEVLAREIASLA